MQPHELSTLPTGERVITEHVPNVRSVSFGFWIGTGSRDETNARAGVSHFIEHLLFKGTSTHSAQEIAEIFDGLGGELNAATSRETTLVYARVPDDRLEPALDVMAGMVYDPAFAEIDSEREVVLEEIAMVDDNPQDLVHDLVAEAVFGGHPLGRPVIGRAEVISSVSKKALTAYHRAAYAADNIVVAAAGQRHARPRRRAARARGCPRREPHVRARKPFGRVPPPGYRFQRKATEQYHVCLGAPGISRRDERRFAASLLDSILGGSASSRLFQEIREKRGMAYSVYSFASQYSDSGQVGLYVGTREENLVECFEIVARELADVAAGNVRPGELERAQENLKGRMLLSLESTSNRMSRLGKSLISDTELLSLDELVAKVDAVTADDVAAVAADLLRLDRLSAAGIGPIRVALPGRDRARQPRSRGACGSVKVIVFGRRGKVGSVLAPALEAAGHELVESTHDADVAVDFTRPEAVEENVRVALEDRRSRRDRHDRLRPGARGGAGPGPRAARLLRAQLRARGGADDALRGRGGKGAAARRDHRAAPRPEARRAVGDGEGDGRAAAAGHPDPLGSATRPGRASGGDLRRAGADADDPSRHHLTRRVRPRRAARAREGQRACRRG